MPYFFVDESGNIGFAFDAGSSRLFVLVMLRVDDPDVLREFVRRLRCQQGLHERYEFKYRRVGSRRVLRTAFFSGLSRLDFAVWAIVIDKARLSPGLAALDRTAFYGWAMGELVAVLPPDSISHAVVVIDDPVRSAKFTDGLRVQMSKVLRRLGRRPGFGKVTGRDAERDEALQCADMIAGALAEHESGGDSWAYQQIAAKFVQVIRWPSAKNLPG